MQGQLFAALRRTRLIEEGLDWEALEYSRCGRTDKGVSALCQAQALQQLRCDAFPVTLLTFSAECLLADICNSCPVPCYPHKQPPWCHMPLSTSGRYHAACVGVCE